MVGSPPCTYFSMLQELNVAVHGHKPEWMAKFDEEKRKAKIHVAFCCTLYQEQLRQGRHFLHEHPWSARSWGLPCIQQLMSHPGVELVQGHMCRFRMTTHIETKDGARGLVKKPTGFYQAAGASGNSSTENVREITLTYHWWEDALQEHKSIRRCCVRQYAEA